MEPKKDIAIVLRVTPYEERHRIVTALTESQGQVTAMAKNSISSRRFGGALDPFVASEWRFTQKPGADLLQLQEAVVKRSFEGLRRDFERLSLASVFNELMLKLAPKYEACEELFRLHANALAALEEAPGTGIELSLLNAYLAKVLQWSGSQPRLQECLSCRLSLEELPQTGILSCVVADAGWLCDPCRRSQTHHVRGREGGGFDQSLLRVTPGAIRDFYASLTLPIRQVTSKVQASRQEHRDLFKFLEALFVYHVPGFDQQPLKGLRFLELESNVRLPPMSLRQNPLH
jgi:DNA repair protein RecO